MGPTWDLLGPTGPRWVQCWPHDPCYLGYLLARVFHCDTYYCLAPDIVTSNILTQRKTTTVSRPKPTPWCNNCSSRPLVQAVEICQAEIWRGLVVIRVPGLADGYVTWTFKAMTGSYMSGMEVIELLSSTQTFLDLEKRYLLMNIIFLV